MVGGASVVVYVSFYIIVVDVTMYVDRVVAVVIVEIVMFGFDCLVLRNSIVVAIVVCLVFNLMCFMCGCCVDVVFDGDDNIGMSCVWSLVV